MAPRANWKGYLKLGELSCAVALYTAASTSGELPNGGVPVMGIAFGAAAAGLVIAAKLRAA